MDTILAGLGYGAAYTALGLALLVLGYWVLDLLTPGQLGRQLAGHGESPQRSSGAGLVGAAWLLGQGLVIFTAIWTNGTSSFGYAFLATGLFGLMGVALLAATFVVLDVITPGRLGDAVCVPGQVTPLAVMTAASLLSMAAIVCASIA